jgi:hypothetical protein
MTFGLRENLEMLGENKKTRSKTEEVWRMTM